MRVLLTAGVSLILMTAVLPAGAELIVIYEAPGSRPITDFLDPLTKRAPDERQIVPGPGDIQLDAAALLPIHTPELSPGPVTAREQDLPLTQPLFLVGADPRSRAWLARNRQRLEAMNAVGLLVEAGSLADLEAIADFAGKLPITPAPATDIARLLKLSHYPVLLTRHGITP